VGRFILPLLLGHDRERFEVICYSDVEKEDALTARMRGAASAWRDIRGMPDEAVARQVEADGVEILVDLTMHMAHNRLRVFAYKPAPVQVTYLAYVSSTGMTSMDYRLSDPYLDPVGEERGYVEETVRLPTSYWCYQQSLATPEVGELPSLKAGRVTFGSLSNFCKVNDRAVEAWGRILARVPGSRLMLWAGEGKHRERVWRQMEGLGVERGRVEFVKFEPAAGYFGRYGEIDVGLDPFPYAGGTTTCDALWMGVPVVTLAGKLGVGRGGVSILSNVGLKELIAQNVEQYVEIAARLAADVEKLKGLRAGLRERMQRSPLMDAQRFVREVEGAYREMWERFCRG
jgi:predicted O-linked N-acetylglucosamine transferase (SPINDLY family)